MKVEYIKKIYDLDVESFNNDEIPVGASVAVDIYTKNLFHILAVIVEGAA